MEFNKCMIELYGPMLDNINRLESILCHDKSKLYRINYMYQNALENKDQICFGDKEREAYSDLRTISKIFNDDNAIYQYIMYKNNGNELSFDDCCQFMNKITTKHIDLASNLKKYMEEENKSKSIEIDFCLYHIETIWDIDGTISHYRSGSYSKEQMCYWFYYNLNTAQVETVNVDELGNRYIVQLPELNDMRDILPKYINSYLTPDSIPKMFHGMEGIVTDMGMKYLIIKPNPIMDDTYRNILEYIRSVPYATVSDISSRWYETNGRTGYKNLLTHLTNISTKLCDISGKITIGMLIKASSQSRNQTKEQTCYFYYNGSIPNGIRIPKNYINKI